jgi:pantoate--beta-alanine ligase
MRVVHSARRVQATAEKWRRRGLRVGLVPTMGALHEGHLSLVRAARRRCDRVIASIFVNPTQFGPKEDFGRYPRTLKEDLRQLRAEKCDLVFTPQQSDLYPTDFDTWVVPGRLAEILEGRSRPTHFRGVATVCLKLFSICKPHLAFFGRKDYQQALVIGRLLADLNLDLKLVVRPTVRESDGLAMSSRNRYLSASQRITALALHRVLRTVAADLKAGRCTAKAAARNGARDLKRVGGLKLDYFEVRNAATLAEPARSDRDLVLLVAAGVGNTRLIDNLRVRLNSGR